MHFRFERTGWKPPTRKPATFIQIIQPKSFQSNILFTHDRISQKQTKITKFLLCHLPFFPLRSLCLLLLTPRNVQAQDFAGLALRRDLEGAAADLAIGREALRRDAGIDGQFKGRHSMTRRSAIAHFTAEHLTKLFLMLLSDV